MVDELLIEIQPYVEDAQKSEEVLKDRFQQINVLAQEAMEMSAEHVKTHDDIKKKLNSAMGVRFFIQQRIFRFLS